MNFESRKVPRLMTQNKGDTCEWDSLTSETKLLFIKYIWLSIKFESLIVQSADNLIIVSNIEYIFSL